MRKASSSLGELVGETPLLAATRQARQLHGQRAAATHHAAGAQIQAHGARDRQAVDAGVLLEALVLEHQQRAAEFCRHRGPAAESAIGHRWRCAR